MEARIVDFAVILRKRAASFLHRVRTSNSNILSVIADRYESPIFKHYIRVFNIKYFLTIVLLYVAIAKSEGKRVPTIN